MDLLKAALLIVLLTATSAMPRGFRRHQDADIPEQKMLDAYHRFIEDSSESSESNSSEESKSSEEMTTRAVTTRAVTPPPVTTRAVTPPPVTTRAVTPPPVTPPPVTPPPVTPPPVTPPPVTPPPVTPPPVTPPPVTSPRMTTVEEGSAATPEVGTISTDQPTVMETTLAPETPTPSVNVTPTCDQCFTVVIPTTAPTTNNRGDN